MNLMVPKMNKLAVITYYNGNYKKIAKLCENLDFKVLFYNKRNDDFGLKVKNIGIDVYDKFHFIVNNYYNLPEIALFLTDTSFDTVKKKRQIEFILENHFILYERSGFLTGHISGIQDEDISFSLEIYKNKKLLKAKYRPFGLWLKERVLDFTDVENAFISKKGVFAVTRDLIMSRELDFYKEILSEIESASVEGHDSEVTHYLERAYVEIFCRNNKKLMFHNFCRYGPIG